MVSWLRQSKSKQLRAVANTALKVGLTVLFTTWGLYFAHAIIKSLYLKSEVALVKQVYLDVAAQRDELDWWLNPHTKTLNSGVSIDMNWRKTTATMGPGEWCDGPVYLFMKSEDEWKFSKEIAWYYD